MRTQGSAARLASATRSLAWARRTLIAMGRANTLLRADVKFYEMGRARVIETCKYLRAVTQVQEQLVVPRSFPLDLYEKADLGMPPQYVLEATNAHASMRRAKFDATALADPIERRCHGLEQEASVVTFYVATRAHDAGVALPKPAAPTNASKSNNEVLTTVQRVLDSPQAMGTLGMGIMGLMGVFAILAGASGRKAPPVLVQHGMDFADLMKQGLGQDLADAVQAADELQAEGECDPANPETCQTAPKPAVEAAPQVDAVQDVQQAVDNIADLFKQKGA